MTPLDAGRVDYYIRFLFALILDSRTRQYPLQLPAKVFVWTVVMGLLAPRQAEIAEAVVSWSRLRSRIAMIDSLALAQEVRGSRDRDPAPATSTGCIG